MDFNLFCLHGRGLVPQVLEECRREVSFSKGRNDGYDALSLVFGALGNLRGGQDSGTARNSAKDSLLGGHVAGHFHGVVAGDLNDLVEQAGVGVSGNKTGSDSLDFVGTGFSAGEDRRFGWFDGHDLQGRIQRLEVLPASRNCSTGSNTADQDVDLAVGIGPDFRAGRLAMDLRVVGIVELLQQKSALCGGDFFGLGNGSTHALGGGGQN
mmetsp:Transcript_13430/g.28145  ORF Transcript_13430/g.28145 Transcript_13430/m.28145 type:complete len:210 (-) Transcript_13430:572-1201(-)